ncbi:MAG: aspartate/glutamate racemase family protein, partial [Gammaproteobacteria bacterium]
HFCAQEFAALSPLPMINGPDSVAAYLKQQEIQRVGILGTRVVMQTCLYGTLSEFDPVAPIGNDLAQVNDDYIAVAIAGAATPAQRQRLLTAGESLVRNQGAEVVLLGGTDLNLVYDGVARDFLVIDSASVHVDAIVNATLAKS